MTDRTLPPVIAQLRHAYAQLVAGTVVRQSQFADGLIGPAIRSLEALAPLEAENAALRARNRALELSADPDALTVAYMQGAEHANDRIRALQARVAELKAALEEAALEMRRARVFISSRERMHPVGIEQWGEFLQRVDALLASATDQSVDANRMGGGDCVGGGEEVDHG